MVFMWVNMPYMYTLGFGYSNSQKISGWIFQQLYNWLCKRASSRISHPEIVATNVGTWSNEETSSKAFEDSVVAFCQNAGLTFERERDLRSKGGVTPEAHLHLEVSPPFCSFTSIWRRLPCWWTCLFSDGLKPPTKRRGQVSKRKVVCPENQHDKKKHPPWMKMYFLLKLVIFPACHVSFHGGVCVFVWVCSRLHRLRMCAFPLRSPFPFHRVRNEPSAGWNARIITGVLRTGCWCASWRSKSGSTRNWEKNGKLGGGFKYCLCSYLRKWSNLTNMFQLDWNHKLENIFPFEVPN